MSKRVVLAGNNEAALFALDLVREGLPAANILVIAPPDTQRAGWQPSLARRAQDLGIRHVAPDSVNDPSVCRLVEEHTPDLLLSVYYTQIFGEGLRTIPRDGALNVHPSLLPRHRGTAPLIWALVEGDAHTGVTVHHIDAGVDTGPVVAQRLLPIHPRDTGYVLHRKAAALVRAMVADLLRSYLEGAPLAAGTPQSGSASGHGGRDAPVNHLDWTASRERIANVVRALAPPLPGAFAILGGEPLLIAEVEILTADVEPTEQPGTLEVAPDGAIVAWASDGPLRIVAYVDAEGDVVAGTSLARERNVSGKEILA
jgi:methionyl-tRNA formyltransferase